MKQHYIIKNNDVTVDLINHPKPAIELIIDRVNCKLVVHRRAKDGLNMYLSMNDAKVKHFVSIKIPYVKRSMFSVYSYYLN